MTDTAAASAARAVAPPSAPPEGGRTRADRRLGWGLVAPAVVSLLAVTAFPLCYNLWNSFHRVNLISGEPGQPLVGISNYRKLFQTAGFGDSFIRTVAFTAVSVTLEVVVGLGLALALNRAFRGRGLVRAAVLIPWAVPTVVSAMLWRTMFDPANGFVDYILGSLHLPGGHTTWLAGRWTAWTAVLVADAWKNTPFVAILLLAGLQVIPGDIYEAARVDGATAWQAFRRLTLPLLKPALMVALVFRTLSAFLIFEIIYIMTGGGPGTSTETLAYLNWRAFLVQTDFGYGGAVSVSLIVMALIIAGAYVRLLRPDT